MKRLENAKLAPQLLISAFPSLRNDKMAFRSDLHLARKFWHMGMGFLIASLYYTVFSRSAAIVTLGSVLGLDILLETIRLKVPAFNQKIMRFWRLIMRNEETVHFSGVPYYLASSVLAIAVFPKTIAVLSILLLAFGDPIASLFGLLFGKMSIQFKSGKSLIGTLAGIATCTLVTLIFLKGLPDFPRQFIFPLTMVGGIVGGASELLPLEIDDNFSIPILSGFSLWLAFIVLGI